MPIAVASPARKPAGSTGRQSPRPVATSPGNDVAKISGWSKYTSDNFLDHNSPHLQAVDGSEKHYAMTGACATVPPLVKIATTGCGVSLGMRERGDILRAPSHRALPWSYAEEAK
jgi:hypothetical protein